MFRKRIAITVVISLALAGLLLVPTLGRLGGAGWSDAEYLQMFQEVVTLVKGSYVEKVDDQKLMNGAINGMLAALDPHSSYLPKTEYSEMKIHLAGAFGGIGIVLDSRDGKLMVEAPIEDSPAFKAGILPGDYIWTIDGKPTRGLSITDCVNRMRGKPGTTVTLGVLRQSETEPLSFRLRRAVIKTRSLKAMLLEPGYGYIAIAEFQERTGDDFQQALRKMAADNGAPLSGLILDLRFNPGGLVDQAVRVAGCFLGDGPKNGLIVTTKGRDPSSQLSLSSVVGEKEPHYPMIVLINGGSASASEIVAGALQDHRRAIIVGTQSFGKGSVQSIIPLRNGDGLKLTTARYYTPSGRSIQAKGITPDIEIEFARKPATTAPVKMPEIREEDLDGHMAGETAIKVQKITPRDPKEQELLQKDNQLARALDLLKGTNLLKERGFR